MAFLLPWFVSSSALPFLFLICGKRTDKCHSEVVAAAATTASLFNENRAAQIHNLTSLEPRVAARGWEVFRGVNRDASFQTVPNKS